MLRAKAVIFLANGFHKAWFLIGADQAAYHGHGAAGVEDVNNGLMVAWSDFDGGVRLTGGGAANQQRYLESLAFHLFGDVRHFVQRRSDEAAQANEIHLEIAG